MTDKTTVNIVAVSLCLAVLAGYALAALLALQDKKMPENVSGIPLAAVGALASLLASTRSNNRDVPGAGTDTDALKGITEMLKEIDDRLSRLEGGAGEVR